MRTHRFYLPPEQCQASLLTLRGREAHHAAHVLRLAAGERVVVLDGAGQELHCNVERAGGEILRLTVAERKRIPSAPFQVTLAQAIPKARMMEDIIQKATELGVHRIVPLLSERVVTRLDGESAAAKAAKWRQTAIEAIKQCGNPWLPRVEAPMPPESFVATGGMFDLAFIAALQDERRPPRDYVQRFVREHHHLPRSVCVWVGPEGDWTPAELALAKSAGAQPISLGRLVLRCETAAIYCVSVLNHELESGGVPV